MTTDYSDFEGRLVAVQEADVALLRFKAEVAAEAVEFDAQGTAAEYLACSIQQVNRLARVWEAFGDDILPDVPLNLYDAAVEAAEQHADSSRSWRRDPRRWLALALRGRWSMRQLRDAADVAKGRRQSRTAWLNCEARVARVGEGFLMIPESFTPSGEVPRRVKVRAYEVLEEAADD